MVRDKIMATVDEDTELRDLVSQALEASGVLGKIRAELRASVFLALEEQDSIKNKTPHLNEEFSKFLETREGRLAISLVREFLEFFKLDYSIVVFDPESGFNGRFENRSGLLKELNISETSCDNKLPLLSELLRRVHANGGTRTEGLTESLSAQQISEARCKFDKYDKDRSGKIEKNELRQIFADVFPNFNRDLLDRYVNDEFRVADKDFSNAIEFGEFLSMYHRIFILCKSSASNDVEDILPFKLHDASKTAGLTKDLAKLPEPQSSQLKQDPIKDGFSLSENGDDSILSKEHLDLPDKKPGFSSFGKEDVPSKDTALTKPVSGSSMSSLAGLPSLVLSSSNQKTGMKKNGLEIIDLVGNERDYEEDFQDSAVSPIGPTPRSARSDDNPPSVENEEIVEEIEEELLRSSASSNDDATTEKTISVVEPSGAGDYFEDVLLT